MLKFLTKKMAKNEKGQAAVEFALVLPLLLLIIMGTMDTGWMFYNQLSVNNASREAAREICASYSSAVGSRDNMKTDVYETAVSVVNECVDKSLLRTSEKAASETGSNCKVSPTVVVYLVNRSGQTVGIVDENGDIIGSCTGQDGVTYSIDGGLSPTSAVSIKVFVTGNMKSLTYVLSTILKKDFIDLKSDSTFKIESGDVTSSVDETP